MSLHEVRKRTVLVTFLFLMVFGALTVSGPVAYAQSTGEAAAKDETNLDTQLYILVATNQDVDDAKLPSSLDGVVRQLRASLPFKNYRLAATLVNRVKNEGRLNLKWIGGPMMAAAAASNVTPSFNDFSVNGVKIVPGNAGQPVIRLEGFRFGSRIPIQSGTAIASNGPAAPIINYEHTGLNTDISMPEGEPVIVGTLNVGPSGDAIILVMSVRRTAR